MRPTIHWIAERTGENLPVDKSDEDLIGNVTSTIRTICEPNSFCKKQQPRAKEICPTSFWGETWKSPSGQCIFCHSVDDAFIALGF